jgi:hypothetical protein
MSLTTVIELTKRHSVGKFVLAALRHPDASFNKALKVQSFVTTPKAILSEFEKQTGGVPWRVCYTPLPKLQELEEGAWKDSKPYATLITLRRIWAEGGTLYDKTDTETIGLKEGATETLETAVTRYIQGTDD